MQLNKNNLFYLAFFCYFYLNCSSLLPKEERVFESNIKMNSRLDFDNWIDKKIEIAKNRILIGYRKDNLISIKYYKRDLTDYGSYISCKFIIRYNENQFLFFDSMSFIINYGETNPRSIGLSRRYAEKVANIGPTSKVEYENVLLPCVREFISLDK